ncbi:hypothetical protein [Saccharopolyspora hattusasensis]|uniref:hypothetical protein n=1 Tax=Saccharopolyspora hattusasensis TaxID=1128679 RepID=UPI003D9952F6
MYVARKHSLAELRAQRRHLLESALFDGATNGGGGDYTNLPAEDLAARLASYAPVDDARIFPDSGGGRFVSSAGATPSMWHLGEEAP